MAFSESCLNASSNWNHQILIYVFFKYFSTVIHRYNRIVVNFVHLKRINMKKLGVLELNRMPLVAYREAEKIPFVVVLDNVRSLHNVGSVFRTSDAYRVERIFLCGVTATPPSAEIHKTALGAEDSVAWQYYKDTRDAINQLHEEDYTVFSIEQVQGSTALQELRLEKEKKYAVVLGNEVKGVQQDVVDMSDACIELPQYGTKHSLNVSVTAGIVIWEFARQLLIE